MALQAGVGVVEGVQQEVEEVRSQMEALRCTAGGLAGQVGPAVAALLAANPPYQPPPHEDKVPHSCLANFLQDFPHSAQFTQASRHGIA